MSAFLFPRALPIFLGTLLTGGTLFAAPIDGFVVGQSSGTAQVRTYNGVSTIPTGIFTAFSSFSGGIFVGGGNVNNDTLADVIVGVDTGAGPAVKAFSGNGGTTLANFFAFTSTFPGGVRVAGGDINHDGFADIIAGAGAGGSPQVSVFSGNGGAQLTTFTAFSPSFAGGVFVAGGDVNNDGFADIIVGAGAGGGPQVSVFSGNGGGLLTSFFAYAGGFTGGVYVASGDVNGDGFSDIIVGPGSGGGPQVKVFSGLDGSTLNSFFAFTAGFTGGVRVGAADVNGDGKDDIIAATGPGTPGEVKVIDAATLNSLVDFNPFGSGYTDGLTVAGLTVPEPASTVLFLGAAALLAARRRRMATA